MPPTLNIISGIPPGASGTGRLLSHLVDRSGEGGASGCKLRFFYAAGYPESRRRMLRQGRVPALLMAMTRRTLSVSKTRAQLAVLPRLARGEPCLLFHPQTLGFRRTIQLIKSWDGPLHLYALDSSFFCIRSYNHIDSETDPCLRCLGGDFRERRRLGCTFSRIRAQNSLAEEYVERIQGLIKTGKARLLAQNRAQADLIQRHFGLTNEVPVVGLWTADWTDVFSGHRGSPGAARQAPADAGAARWDVVFHSYFVPAKGARWMLEVARSCPEIRFLFPCSRPREIDAPSNVEFREMTWETGLAREIRRSPITCLPSFWSASIEGALIKSIVAAPRVAVARNETAFSSELPAELVLKLSTEPAAAAGQLRAALAEGGHPDEAFKRAWIDRFHRANAGFLENILAAMGVA